MVTIIITDDLVDYPITVYQFVQSLEQTDILANQKQIYTISV